MRVHSSRAVVGGGAAQVQRRARFVDRRRGDARTCRAVVGVALAPRRRVRCRAARAALARHCAELADAIGRAVRPGVPQSARIHAGRVARRHLLPLCHAAQRVAAPCQKRTMPRRGCGNFSRSGFLGREASMAVQDK